MSPLDRNRRLGFRAISGVLVLLSGLLPAVAISPGPVAAASTTIVVSQVYGGGGNAGATWRNDFIELFNRGTTSVNITGWSVQYAASTGTTWSRTNVAGTLAPGQYFLVEEAIGAGGTTSLPTPDSIGTIAMSATAGKIALLNNQTTITAGTTCPTGGTVVDLVGYGAGTNCFEGSGPTGTLSNTTAALRKGNGLTDTDDNASDFTVGAPNPRNTASPLNPPGTAPTVTADPSDQTVDAGTTVTFSAAATGSPSPSVKWQDSTDGGGTWADVPGATGLSLAFIAGAAQTGNRYRAVFQNLAGSATSASAKLTVTTPPIVISQIYGGGGNAGATLRYDFIELFNRGNTTVDLGNWSVQYAATTGVNWSRTNLSGSLAAGRYYLIQEAQGAGGTTNLPAPDAIGTIAVDQAAGKVVLVSNQNTIAAGTSCPTGAKVVDLVGYGTGTDCFEGPGPAPTISNTTAAVRKGNGQTDTDNNASDFAVGSPNPRNSASTSTGQTISFGPLADKTYGDPDFDVSASASSGLPVSFSSLTGGVCSVTGATVHIVAAGTCTIGADQAGDGTYDPAPSVDQGFTVAKADPIIVVTGYSGAYDGAAHGASGSATGVFGEDLSADLDLGPSFTDVPGGTADWTFTDSTGDYLDAAGSVAIVISSTGQTISFGPLADKTYGDPDFDVSASASSGLPVSFSSLTGGVCSVTGATVHIVAAGTCTIGADQAGDGTYDPAPSVDQGFTVAKADPIIVVTGYSGAYDGAAHGASGSATGVFGEDLSADLDLGPSFTDVPGGTADWTFTDSTGDYLDAAGSVAIVISSTGQTISFGPLADKTYGDPDFDVSASASSGLPVSFSSLTGGVCSVTGATVHIVAAGTCTIGADQAGDGTYDPAPSVDQGFTVAKADPIIVVTGYSGAYDGAAHGASGSATGVFGEDLSADLDLGPSFTDVPGGTADWTFTDSTGDYLDAAGSVAIVISSTGQTISFGPLADKTYGDPDFDVSASASSGLPVSFSSLTGGVCSVTGATVHIVAAGTCTIGADQAGDGTYDPAPSVDQGFTVVAGAVATAPPTSTVSPPRIAGGQASLLLAGLFACLALGGGLLLAGWVRGAPVRPTRRPRR